jgi:enamine deaminase RidA (YjgF/YER057c/UK114 family)
MHNGKRWKPQWETLMQTTTEHVSQTISAERRLQELGIHLPVPPEPFGTYTEAVQVGSLLFLSGTLPTEGRTAKFVGRVGAELDAAAGREAARLAAMNAVAIARQHLGSLDRVKRIVRLGVSVATEGNVRDQPKVADGASEFLEEVFGPDKILRAWCMASRVFHLEPLSKWSSYLRYRDEQDGSDYYGNTYQHIIGSARCERAAGKISNLLSNHYDRWPLDFLS